MRADCHLHVFDPARFPFNPAAPYHPAPHETGSAEVLSAVLEAHGFGRALVVGPTSGYREDNRCLLDALGGSGGRWRGVAMVEDGVGDEALAALRASGVVGVRLDLLDRGTAWLRGNAPLLGRLARAGLFAEIQCERDQLAEIGDVLLASPAALLFDHCGRPDPAAGLGQPGFRALLRLAGRRDVAVKLSGAFRFSSQGWPFADTDPYARALVEAFGPGRCVWGSDWPFLRMPMRMDYGLSLSILERWVPAPAHREEILVGTPARLFGFDRV